MDSIDVALLEAWGRLAVAVKRDRVEAMRRSLRRTRGALSRPVRAWCLCLRASDRRLKRYGYVPKGYAEHRLPHSLLLDSDSVRELCKPVSIPWPGVDWEHAAAMLGRDEESLRAWMKSGALQVKHSAAFPAGKRGRPVPWVWSRGALDPNADHGRAPHGVWGTLWQWLWRSVPDDLLFELKRAPVTRADGRTGEPKHRGWQWVCPGRGAWSLVDGEWLRGPGTCGRLVSRVFVPMPVWTLMDAMGVEDPLEVVVRIGGEARQRNSEAARQGGEELDAAERRAALSVARPMMGPACHACHRVRYFSLVDAHGWNEFVTHLSAGLLYGREVKRPREVGVERRRAYRARGRRVERMEGGERVARAG